MFGRKGKQSLELDAGDIGKQGGSTPQKDVESVSGGMDTKQDGDDINIDLSGARRRSRRASASDVLVPRWLHIMHYVVHAVFLLLLILLIIAIAMVETDAKDDGEDGVVNSILKAFKLQVDGAVSQGGFDCSSADDTLDSSTQQMMLDKAESFQMIFEDPSKYSLDELDKYLSPDAVILLTSGAYTVTTFKELLAKFNSTYYGDYSEGQNIVLNKVISGSRVLLKAERYDSTSNSLINSKFVSSDFDTATGKIVRLASYPSLDIESKRMTAVKTFNDVILGNSAVESLDTIKFDEDFRIYYRGGALDYKTIRSALSAGGTSAIYGTYKFDYYVSGYRIVCRLERTSPISLVWFMDYSFSVDNSIKSIRASTSSESSKRGQIISQFSRVFNTFDYDSLDDLVTDDWTFHYYLGIETLEEFKTSTKAREESLKRTPPDSLRKLVTLPNEYDTYYQLWTRQVDPASDDQRTDSGIWIHKFDSSSDLIKYSYMFFTRDLSPMIAAVDAIQGMRLYAFNMGDDDDNGAKRLQDYDKVAFSDDFKIDSFAFGYQTKDEFRTYCTGSRQYLQSAAGTAVFDTSTLKYVEISRMISDHIVVSQGMWVPKDLNISQAASSSSSPRFRVSNVVTVADIFYFDPAVSAAKPVLKEVYMYNATWAMSGIDPSGLR